MPGIIGFTSTTYRDYNSALLDKLTKIICHTDYHTVNKKIISQVYTGLVDFNFISNYRYYDDERIYICLYGDFIINDHVGPQARKILIEKIVNHFPDLTLFKNIDGLFNVLVYDKQNNDIYIIIDRNGLSHLYYGVFDNELFWSSELRFFISLNKNLNILKESIYSFIVLGYLINNETWFREVKLVPPSSYIKWNIDRKLLKIEKYWDHRNIQSKYESIDEKKTIADLIDLFDKAVSKRYNENEKIGITLSGGMDSRAIFAAIKNNKPLTAITRGYKGSRDIRISRKVARIKPNVNHMTVDMNEDNWLRGRVDAVTATCGQKDIINMNTISSLSIQKKYFDINLDGAGGDGILRGGHIGTSDKQNMLDFLNRYITYEYSFSNEIYDKLLSYYNEVNSPERFYIEQRVRRFTIFGSILGHDYGMISRFPFLDHDLIDYLNNIPYTVNREMLFLKMAQTAYPGYFTIIDIKTIINKSRLFNRSRYYFKKIGVHIKPFSNKYHDYNNWFRKEDGLALIKKQILNNINCELKNYIPEEIIKNTTQRHLEGDDNAKSISRYLTLEILLQYIKTGVNPATINS